jgi:hypothetical protein
MTTVGAGTIDRDFPANVKLGNGKMISGRLSPSFVNPPFNVTMKKEKKPTRRSNHPSFLNNINPKPKVRVLPLSLQFLHSSHRFATTCLYRILSHLLLLLRL